MIVFPAFLFELFSGLLALACCVIIAVSISDSSSISAIAIAEYVSRV